MTAISNQETTWKEAKMAGAEKITDYWDITKAYAGRLAEVVLFLCMCAQIIGVLPGVHYPGWIDNIILGVQVIMLDMGGFALGTLADHARDNGQEEAAKKAEQMGNFLIGLVIVTLALIAVGQLADVAGPYAKVVREGASDLETVLILVRVISTVKYIHVIHSLRASALALHPTHQPTQLAQDDQIAELQKTVEDLQSHLKNALTTHPPLQPTQVVEVPTQNLHTTIQPIKIRSTGTQSGFKMLAQVASSTAQDDGPIEDETTTEATVVESERVIYPDVPGVSVEKVRQIIDAHLSGTKWRDIAGNYSQTIKPVREMWESLHTSTQAPIQPTQTV